MRFCERVIPDKEGEVIGKHSFDDQMLHMPQAALREAEREVVRTADITLTMIQEGRTALLEMNPDKADHVMRYEDEVDDNCRTTEQFIDKIREEELGQEDTIWRMKLLAILTDVERVGDLSNNIAEFAFERLQNGIRFSKTGVRELERMFDLVEETYSTAIKALKTKNRDLAKEAVMLEDQVDALERELKKNHRDRMRDGICMPEADTIFVETLRNLERISDHADNIALDVIMDN